MGNSTMLEFRDKREQREKEERRVGQMIEMYSNVEDIFYNNFLPIILKAQVIEDYST